MPNPDLVAHFERLSDEELSLRAGSGGLTDEAQAVAIAALKARGLPVPSLPSEDTVEEEAADYLGDMVTLEKGLDPTDAHLLCSLLQRFGIQADAGDTNLVQTYALLSIALGGVRIRVPAAQLKDATEILAAYRRGEFALGNNFDVGAP